MTPSNIDSKITEELNKRKLSRQDFKPLWILVFQFPSVLTHVVNFADKVNPPWAKDLISALSYYSHIRYLLAFTLFVIVLTFVIFLWRRYRVLGNLDSLWTQRQTVLDGVAERYPQVNYNKCQFYFDSTAIDLRHGIPSDVTASGTRKGDEQ